MKVRQDVRHSAFGSGPAPGFFNEAPWRIRVEPRRADWDEPHGREHLR